MLSFPSAKPYGYNFDPARTALVIIDAQRDFLHPNGFGAVQCGDPEIFASVFKVVPVIKSILAASRALGLHIFHTREGHEPDLSDLSPSKRDRQMKATNGHHNIGIGDKGPMGRLLVRGEYGHDIIDDLKPRPGEVVIDKPGKGSFWSTDFHRRLMARDITHLLLCGVTTECCVTTTAREANDRGFECCILSDGTGGFNSTFVEVSLEMISSFDGLFGFTAKSQELLTLVGSPSQNLTTPPKTPPIHRDIDLSLTSLRNIYRERALSPSDIMTTVWEHCKASQESGSNIWIHLRSKENILADVHALTQKYISTPFEDLPVLFGVPFAIKDNIDFKGIPTTAACLQYSYMPSETAIVVSTLLDAGAILIGKTNMDQFATGLSGCRSPYGTVHSVYGQNLISGGSSSGSAVAVAAGLVTFSLGTDTAGSGRVPAALNGIVGFKPTKGTISTRGVLPACASLDTVSIFSLNVEDTRRVWYVVDRPDEKDLFTKEISELPLSLSSYHGVQSRFRFAVPPISALGSMDQSRLECFWNAAALLTKLSGNRAMKLSDETYQPFVHSTALLYQGTLVNERVAGIGYEFLVQNMENLHPTTKTLFMEVLSRSEPSWKFFEDQAVQLKLRKQVAQLFKKGCMVDTTMGPNHGGPLDIILLPTTTCHPSVEQMNADPIGLNARMGEFTHFANVLDLCAVSVNAGWTEDGLPFGVSLIGAKGLDGRLLSIASTFEREFCSTKF